MRITHGARGAIVWRWHDRRSAWLTGVFRECTFEFGMRSRSVGGRGRGGDSTDPDGRRRYTPFIRRPWPPSARSGVGRGGVTCSKTVSSDAGRRARVQNQKRTEDRILSERYEVRKTKCPKNQRDCFERNISRIKSPRWQRWAITGVDGTVLYFR